MAVLQCCIWLLAEMPSSRAVFDLNNRKSWVNRHLRFCQFSNKLLNVPCVGVYFNSEICCVWCHGLTNSTHPTLHTSIFGRGNRQNHRCLFTLDLRLCKSNTARDERISTNSQTQYWRTAIFWLSVNSSHSLFLRWIEESSQLSPWLHQCPPICYHFYWPYFKIDIIGISSHMWGGIFGLFIRDAQFQLLSW